MVPGLSHSTVHRPAWLRNATLKARLNAARSRLLASGVRRTVIYIWRDEFADALDLLAHDASCYHIDDEYRFDERDLPNSAREIALLERVDQVIVHSPALMTKKGGLNAHTALIPNGVDFKAYATRREPFPDLMHIAPPRIGYTGVIKKQLDLALLVRLARARPGHSFVLVGPIMNVKGKEAHVEELRRMPNVFFLGNKAVEDLPAYVQHFDVCLMCYDVNAYTKYIYPLKLNEYLAAGRPTISSAIDSVKGLDRVVHVAGTSDEWLRAIDLCLSPNALSADAVTSRRTFAQKHDWDTLVDEIARLIRETLARADTPRVVNFDAVSTT
jgi:glycosyltransferase involved in cell wall biosynthesis